MSSIQLIVRHVAHGEPTCFVTIPANYSQTLLPHPVAFRCSWTNDTGVTRICYVASGGRTHAAEREIWIPSPLAHCLQIPDGVRMLVEPVFAASVARSVSIEPLSPDDWELVAANAQKIEQSLLEQASILTCGEEFPVHVHGRTHATLIVRSKTPHGFVRLAPTSELDIAPKQRMTAQRHEEIAAALEPAHRMRVQPGQPSHSRAVAVRSAATFGMKPGSVVIFKYKRKTTALHIEENIDIDEHHLRVADELRAELNIPLFCTVRIRALHSSLMTFVDKPLQHLMLQPVCIVDGSSNTSLHSSLKPIELEISSSKLKSDWKHWLQKQSQPIAATDNSILRITDTACVRLSFSLTNGIDKTDSSDGDKNGTANTSSQSVHVNVTPAFHFIAPIQMKDSMHPVPLVEPIIFDKIEKISLPYDATTNMHVKLSDLGSFDDLIEQSSNFLRVLLSPSALKARCQLSVLAPGGLMVVGPAGMGKSALSFALAKHFSEETSILANTVIISNTELARLKIEEACKRLRLLFGMALARAPTLVVLDDIDKLLPIDTEHPNLRAAKLAECLSDVLTDLRCTKHAVGILATCTSINNIHSCFNPAVHFSVHLDIKAPDLQGRIQIIYKALSSYDVHRVDLKRIALRCEGYNCTDLHHVANRAIYVALQRSMKQPSQYSNMLQLEIRHSDLEKALQHYTPMNLKDLSLANTQIDWSCIGGMQAVKDVLKDTLELPSKFARIFSTVPIKLRSGLLLYGPPGCGKTLIASAVAHECGVHLISVKGPELLNKYIGASEQSVRDTFARARAAAPCVLFFDEFEAIAPKRGGDSTGVTDRVVNQFLCELDGVEGRGAGLYVLAASSRPDLIDPALLRPGRIDKTIYCPFPDQSERLKILQAICRNIKLSPDVDLIYIASETENYSGADLQAIVSTAQINLLHAALDSMTIAAVGSSKEILSTHSANNVSEEELRTVAPISSAESNMTLPLLDQNSLLEALRNSSPSLSKQQKLLYDRVYAKFVTSKEAAPAEFDVRGQLKTTFA